MGISVLCSNQIKRSVCLWVCACVCRCVCVCVCIYVYVHLRGSNQVEKNRAHVRECLEKQKHCSDFKARQTPVRMPAPSLCKGQQSSDLVLGFGVDADVSSVFFLAIIACMNRFDTGTLVDFFINKSVRNVYDENERVDNFPNTAKHHHHLSYSLPILRQRFPRFLRRLCHDVNTENTALASSYS